MRLALLPILALLLLPVGCAPTARRAATPADGGPYLGPTLALPELVSQINARAAALPTLWAGGRFEAELPGESGDVQFLNGSLNLLHAKPRAARLVGTKVTERVFDTGLNDETYWFHAGGPAATFWYGSLDSADDLDAGRIPIRPDLLLDVLGVAGLDEDLLAEPAPVMIFAPDPDLYVVDWHRTAGGQKVPVRQVWYDRETLRPERVFLWKPDGRLALSARLSDWQDVEGAAPGGEVATRYAIELDEGRGRFDLWLDAVRLSNRGVPRPISFRMPDPARLGAETVINLDAADAEGR